MTVKASAAIHRDEIAHLAYLNWEKDGRPHGRDGTYWHEAEQQLKATKHLLTAAHQAQGDPEKKLVKIRAKAKRNSLAPGRAAASD
jgi:hypothetical protein